PFRMNFRGDDGTALTLPLIATQNGSALRTSTAVFDGVLNANTTLLLDTGSLPNTVVGSVELLSPGPIGGFAIFRSSPPQGAVAEGPSPLQSTAPSTVVLPFDNTAGYVTGIALVNISQVSADITVTAWDDNGTQVASQTLTIAPNGHTSF